MEAEEPVQVYSVSNPMVAEMIRNALTAEGIECELSGESQGGFAGVLDEIQILTHATDAQRALEIIKEMQSHHSDDEDDNEDEPDHPEEGIQKL